MSGSVKPIFNADEAMILMLYLRDTRTATIANLQEIQKLLTIEEKELHGMTSSVINILQELSDEDFLNLDLLSDSPL